MPRSRFDCHFFPLHYAPAKTGLLGGPVACKIRFKHTHRHKASCYPVDNPRRAAWLRVSKKAIGSPKSRKKKRLKPSLLRRAKKAQRQVGNRRSDQAKRNRKAVLCRRFIYFCPRFGRFILPRPPGEILSAEQVTSNEPSNDELAIR